MYPNYVCCQKNHIGRTSPFRMVFMVLSSFRSFVFDLWFSDKKKFA